MIMTEFFIHRSNYKITFPRLKIPFVVKCHTLTLEQSHSFNSLKRFNSKTKYCSFFFTNEAMTVDRKYGTHN